jgi:2-methylcitrate dehydratase PrpD
MVQEHDIKPDMVGKVTLFAPEYNIGSTFVHKPRIGDVQTRDFPYLCAIVITERRRITPTDYMEPRIRDTKLFKLARKVGYIETETTIPLKQTVKITLKNGKTFEKQGKPLPLLTSDNTKKRFRYLASRVFKEERIEQIIEEIDKLENTDDLTHLVGLLIR